MMGTFILNSVGVVHDNLEAPTLEGSMAVYSTAKYIAAATGKTRYDDVFMDKLYREVGISMKAQFDGVSGNANEDISAIHSFMLNKANEEFISKNIILKDAIKPSSKIINGRQINTIEVSLQNIDSTNQGFIHHSWDAMYKENPAFTKLLVRGLFHLSGFTVSKNNFYQMIPVSLLEEIGYTDFIKDLRKDLNSTDINDFHIQSVIQNNYNDAKLIPEFSRGKASKSLFSNRLLEFPVSELLSDKRISEEEGIITAPEYITSKIQINEEGDYENRLYKLAGVYNDGTTGSLYYSQMNKLGIDTGTTSIREFMNEKDAGERYGKMAEIVMKTFGFSAEQTAEALGFMGTPSSYKFNNAVTGLSTEQVKGLIETLLSLRKTLSKGTAVMGTFNEVTVKTVTDTEVEGRVKFCLVF